jgi:hypothetical protein
MPQTATILYDRRSPARLEEAVSAFREALQGSLAGMDPCAYAVLLGHEHRQPRRCPDAARGKARDAKKAKLAVQQIEAALSARRDGGHTPSAAFYEARLPKARVLVAKLAKRRGVITPQRLIAAGP